MQAATSMFQQVYNVNASDGNKTLTTNTLYKGLEVSVAQKPQPTHNTYQGHATAKQQMGAQSGLLQTAPHIHNNNAQCLNQRTAPTQTPPKQLDQTHTHQNKQHSKKRT